MQKGKKKYSSEFKELVVGCYLTCYNYHEVARIMKISVNGAKRIVQIFRKNNPRKYAQISTKIIKRTDEKLDEIIFKTMCTYVDSVNPYDNSFTLLTLMNRQDNLYYKRQKELYRAKREALAYECKRLEKAILLRDSKELLKLIKESKHDNTLYEPLDLDFLAMSTRYSEGDFFDARKKLSNEDKLKYNNAIKEFLIDRGYKLETGENNKRNI